MGAVTGTALELARHIAAEYAGENDTDLRSWARGQILGAWRLVSNVEPEHAAEAAPEFRALAARIGRAAAQPWQEGRR